MKQAGPAVLAAARSGGHAATSSRCSLHPRPGCRKAVRPAAELAVHDGPGMAQQRPT